jgi:hypothetical protein
MIWRVGIVSIGVLWSVLLFRQQVLTENEQDRVIAAAVGKAVNESNKRSDQQIGQQIEKLKADFGKELHEVSGGLSHQMSSGISTLNQNLSKVGQPPEPKFAQIQFSLWVEREKDYPRLVDTVQPDSEGKIVVYWTGKNVSDTSAENLEFWIFLCSDCIYAKEPEGFDRPSGTNDLVRHRVFGSLNSGVAMPKMGTALKVNRRYHSFELGFKYSCKSCGKMPANLQTLTLKVAKPLVPSFPFPSTR